MTEFLRSNGGREHCGVPRAELWQAMQPGDFARFNNELLFNTARTSSRAYGRRRGQSFRSYSAHGTLGIWRES